ncbi:DUF4145 domain-containing protein [Pandoraea terrigena]|uniref:DUF4145 domain-containing protein n=1 Tax=Pandoraea terrigena TaxID=2508292 RepID=A0A5E4YE61_9BURK|nr:DUF4145 domain-containing protein [Pandoraea terrigena]VVE46605.1 hypothetical protein PTE31013_04472 [Pandoraea terrigena]
MTQIAPPSFSNPRFNCPHCGAFSAHTWYESLAFSTAKDSLANIAQALISGRTLSERPKVGDSHSLHLRQIGPIAVFIQNRGVREIRYGAGLNLSKCESCDGIAVWVAEAMIYPELSSCPPPNEDLADDIKADYNEARAIVEKSPRGAAALLRLCLQKLCGQLGYQGLSIDAAIAKLYADKVDPRLIMVMDIVRVYGNNAVHPGELDLRDDRDIAIKLFQLINVLAGELLSTPKQIAAMFGALPEGAKEAAERRNQKATGARDK